MNRTLDEINTEYVRAAAELGDITVKQRRLAARADALLQHITRLEDEANALKESEHVEGI